MEEKKHTPTRTCLACFKKNDKKLFLALVKEKDGRVSMLKPREDIDDGKKSRIVGRSVYFCLRKACISAILEPKKCKFIESRLQTKIPEEILKELSSVIIENP